MPELIEVEAYRVVADCTVGRVIRAAHAPDPWFCKGTEPAEVEALLAGRRVVGTRRRGKLLMLDTDGPVLGLRFGMTGKLLVDGIGPIEKLEYSSDRDDPAWHRFGLSFAGGGDLSLVDSRRLGGVEIDPDEERLGPDAATIGKAALRDALAGSSAPLKARLLDQARVAGIGNLICDEALLRARLDPARLAGALEDREVARLHRQLRATIALLTERGGSHTGDLQIQRSRDGRCPRCHRPLQRRTVGGRTTYSCPHHQR
ncbi:formamidopyrimidine-DNA glycosylase [soil metagenome]